MRLLGARRVSELSPRHVSPSFYYSTTRTRESRTLLTTSFTQLNTTALDARLFNGDAGLDGIKALL